MKTAISLPDSVQLGLSRDDLYTKALPAYLRKFNRYEVRDKGLPKDSVVNISQIITLNKTFLTERISSLPDSLQDQVDEGLRMILYL